MVTFSCFNCLSVHLSIHPFIYSLFGDTVSTMIWLLTYIFQRQHFAQYCFSIIYMKANEHFGVTDVNITAGFSITQTFSLHFCGPTIFLTRWYESDTSSMVSNNFYIPRSLVNSSDLFSVINFQGTGNLKYSQ